MSFRGANGTRNLKTDINTLHMRLGRILSTSSKRCDRHANRKRSCEGAAIAELLEKAKLHKGFAEAYTSAARQVMLSIQDFHSKNVRPVVFTGHSLDGKLVAVCALDCFLSPGFTQRNIMVTTLGTPCVGSVPFQNFYDNCVSAH